MCVFGVSSRKSPDDALCERRTCFMNLIGQRRPKQDNLKRVHYKLSLLLTHLSEMKVLHFARKSLVLFQELCVLFGLHLVSNHLRSDGFPFHTAQSGISQSHSQVPILLTVSSLLCRKSYALQKPRYLVALVLSVWWGPNSRPHPHQAPAVTVFL